jgi:HD-like signal output (HDOD) protein
MNETTWKIDYDALDRKLRNVFPIPKILEKIMRIMNDPKANAAMLEKAFEFEPSFSMRILSLANSAYYGCPAKVTNIRTAITLLGFNLLKSLVIHASINELFRVESDIPGFSGSDLWKHSVGVGVGARMISRRLRLGEAEDYFTVGLLHDMGLLIEYQFYREAFAALLAKLREQGDGDICRCERDVLGTDHSALAERLFAKWNLPEKIVKPVRYHHAPLTAPEPQQAMASVVYLANWIARRNAFGFTYPGSEKVDLQVLALLKLEPVDLDVLCEDFKLEAEEISGLLE